MTEIESFLHFIASLPLIEDVVQWGEEFLHLPPIGKVRELIELFLKLLGLTEFIKWLYRRISGRHGVLERKNEVLEEELKAERLVLKKANDELAEVKGDLKATRARLPEHALAIARREWRDNNDDPANNALEKWFDANREHLADISFAMAKYHIAHAIPDPADHLTKASNMLALAKAAAPERQEARDLWLQFDEINEPLQEQIFIADGQQVAWNSGMRSEALIQTFMDAASYCYEKGRWLIAPLFADRAAQIASVGGPQMRPVWFTAETLTASYLDFAGRSSEALTRLDKALLRTPANLTGQDERVLTARYFRAKALSKLGRYDDALKEIDDFAPIQAEVLGPRHPHVLGTRYLRAQALLYLGRYDDALKQIDDFAPIQAEVLGSRHPDAFATRFLRAQALSNLGRYDDALKEIDDFAPTQGEVLGSRHPYVLVTRSLRIGIAIATNFNHDFEGELRSIIGTLASVTNAVWALRSRYRLSRLLFNAGRLDEARSEVLATMASFDTSTAPTHELLRACRTLLAMIDGTPTKNKLIV